MTFDPDAEREALAESIEILRRMSPERFEGGLGHAAILTVNGAIRGWFAGLHDQARDLIAERREWLRLSLEREESFGDTPLIIAARVAEALPVTAWLLGEGHDVAGYRESVRRYERFLASDEPRSDADLSDFARLRVSAGNDPEEPRLLTPNDARTPIELAYAAGRWRGSRRIVGAGELVLARYAPQWFDGGSTTRLAAWLKIVYWDTGVTTDPDEAMRRLLGLLR